MTAPGRKRPSKRSLLTDEDEALWETAAETVKPLARKQRVHPKAPASAEGEKGPASTASHSGHDGSARGRREAQSGVDARQRLVAPPVPPARRMPPLAEFDERHHRKIRSGRVEIDRRVDLHGMRQAEAHAVLRRFLLECHADGLRRVLVITGKGAPRARSNAHFDAWGSEQAGVLRREVPRWLAEPDLRPIVVSYTTAAVQHGGEGALYVHLRRRRE